MKKIVFFLTIMLFSTVLPAQKLSMTQLKKDFDIFRTALTEAHPGIYRFESRSAVDSLFHQTEKLLVDSLSQQDFYKILSPLVAAIHCGHTKFNPEGVYDENHLYHYFYGTDKLFPLKLFISKQGVYYIDSYDKAMDFEKGTKILSVNGTSVDELISFFFKNIVADGRVQSSRFMELSKFFSSYYANLIGSPDSFRLSLMKKDGTIFTSTIQPVSLAKIQEYEKTHKAPAEPTFSLSFPKEKIALMRIKAFYPLEKKDDFSKFLSQAFAELQDKKTKKLIIDLRDNEGGNDRWGALLYSYLTDKPFRYYEELRIPNKNYSFKQYAQMPGFYGLLKLMIRKDSAGGYKWTRHKNLKIQQPQKNPFMGEVVALINGFSFSVTAEFAAVAKASGRVKFIGQETGGAYIGNNSGTFVIVTLPNSRLSLGIPMVGYYMAVPAIQPPDRGVMPDVEVKPDVSQILDGEDVELRKAVEI